jgi:hypothetical protein
VARVWTGESHSDEIVGGGAEVPFSLVWVMVLVKKMVIRVFTLNIVAQTGKIRPSSSMNMR